MTDLRRLTAAHLNDLGWDGLLGDLEAGGLPVLVVDEDDQTIGVLAAPAPQPATVRQMTRTEAKSAGLVELLTDMATTGAAAVLIVHQGSARRPRALLDLPDRADPAVRALVDGGDAGVRVEGGATAGAEPGPIAGRRLTANQVLEAGLDNLIDELIAGAPPILIVDDNGRPRALLGTHERPAAHD